MSRRDELLRLAELVEGAKEGDRELDALVAATLRVGTGHAWAYKYPAWLASSNGRVNLERHGPSFSAPAFTTSFDAAMSLRPERWSIRLSLSEGGNYPNVSMGRSYPTNKSVCIEGHTAPLTIVRACLLALAATLGDDHD